jgi:hypothetical protein
MIAMLCFYVGGFYSVDSRVMSKVHEADDTGRSMIQVQGQVGSFSVRFM